MGSIYEDIMRQDVPINLQYECVDKNHEELQFPCGVRNWVGESREKTKLLMMTLTV